MACSSRRGSMAPHPHRRRTVHHHFRLARHGRSGGCAPIRRGERGARSGGAPSGGWQLLRCARGDGASSRLWRRRRCGKLYSKLRIGDDAARRNRSMCRDGRRRSAPASPQFGCGEGRCRHPGAGSTSIAMGLTQLEGATRAGTVAMFVVVKQQPWRTRPRSVLGALVRRRWRRGHDSIAGATTTSTTSTHLHPEPPTPSPAFTSPTFAEKVAESIEEFLADVVVVVRDPHVEGAVENHVNKIDKEHRRRYVAKHRHGTFL